jgi:TldD protein
MKDFATEVVDLLDAKQVDYGDVRIIDTATQSIDVKNGKVEAIASSDDLGFGVRLLANGAWGFASSSRLEKAEAERVVDEALAIARASATVCTKPVELTRRQPRQDSYKSRWKENPIDVPLHEKIDLLLAADELLRKEKAVKISEASMAFYRTKKVFASTEGYMIDQEIIESGGGLSATAVKENEVQVRSYPNSFRGNYATSGYEFVRAMDLVKHAPRVAEEAAQLLVAPQCPSEVTTIILDSDQLALQVHESIGHPIELDRVLGTEASYAGTSFVTIDKLGTFRYGSDKVTVVADATVPGGLGTFGYDDEGTDGQRVTVVDKGIFVGYLTSRETAPVIGRESGGAMLADGWNRIPLIRMTNINLEPGEWSLADLIADTDKGIFFSTNKSWSIDDRRLNFQFGTEIAWEIEGGRLGRIYKNPNYTGITPEFWNSCDAVCKKDHWQLWGLLNCGKGEPGQAMHVGHGTAPARFRNVRVGIAPSS